ncbi:uncharacterized protein MELLADRAFT_113840 [Melampsora larici-populina 98AG31]|uniref:Secreted protein n=1 Tax=Melampsora larici-populina (strain 98AG31 / pathotype 3-4-7) TaxID=747676 RepID=F4SB77_MELLP|nr:uncharacterized protein MELLADRAFT_113840 [Melampsora larici-populina 98AG31]EGF98101.1 hypothetical protein MELLADRAFT_113840 [Melampsora larici-populina 98AG31]
MAYISRVLLISLYCTKTFSCVEQLGPAIEADEVLHGRAGVKKHLSINCAVGHESSDYGLGNAVGSVTSNTPSHHIPEKQRLFSNALKEKGNKDFHVVLDKESYEEVSKVINSPRRVGREWIELSRDFKAGFFDEMEAQKRLRDFIKLYSNMKTSLVCNSSIDQVKTKTTQQDANVEGSIESLGQEAVERKIDTKVGDSPTDHSCDTRQHISEAESLEADHKGQSGNGVSKNSNVSNTDPKEGPSFPEANKDVQSQTKIPTEFSQVSPDDKETQKEQRLLDFKSSPLKEVASVDSLLVGKNFQASEYPSNIKMRVKTKKGKRPGGSKPENVLHGEISKIQAELMNKEFEAISTLKAKDTKEHPQRQGLLELLKKTLQLHDQSKYVKVELSWRTFKELEDKWNFKVDELMVDTLSSIRPYLKGEQEAHRRFASLGHQCQELRIKRNWENQGKAFSKEARRIAMILKVNHQSPSFETSTEDEMKEINELVNFVDDDEWDRLEVLFERKLMKRLGTFGLAVGSTEYKDSRVLKYTLKKRLASQGMNIPLLYWVSKILELDSAEVSWETAETSSIVSKVELLVKLLTGTNYSPDFLGAEPLESWTLEYTRDHLCYAGDWLSELFQSRLKLLAKVSRTTYKGSDDDYTRRQSQSPNEISLGEELIATHVGINFEMLKEVKDVFQNQKTSNPFIKKGAFVGKWDDCLSSDILILTIPFHEYFQCLDEKVINLDNWINEKLKKLKIFTPRICNHES